MNYLSILKRILIILMCVLIVDRVTSYVFMHVFFSTTISGESGGTINYVINRKQDLDFLIIGASRAKHGINPTKLSSLGEVGYNLGINGTTPLNSLLNLDILLGSGVHPKVVLLQTDLSDYITKNDTKAMMVDQIRRVYPYDTPLVREYVHRIGLPEEIKYSFDLYKLNRKVVNILYNFAKRNSIGESSGFVPLPTIPFPPDPTYGASEFLYDTNSTSTEAVERIKKLCDEHDIKLIVVFMPFYNNVHFNKSEQEKIIADFKQKGINNIVDLSDITKLPGLEDVSKWRDEIHLNAQGAETFSNILETKLQNQIR